MTTSHKSVQAFIWALCLMAGSAFAQSSLPACQGSDVTRWTNCFGTTTYFKSGDKYVGEYKDGKRNGQGTLTFRGGDKYVGEYKDDEGNGQGTFTFANGDKFVGEFKDSARDGQGTLTLRDGMKHVGEWRINMRYGQGIEYASNGSITRQGRWENNILVQSFAVDAQRFPFNSPTQTASAQPSTAERVQLAAAAQSQLPPCQSNDVSRWTNCFGTYIWTYGDKYVGEWKDGKANGQGIDYRANGTIIRSGRYAGDNLVQSFAIDPNRFPFNAPTQTASATPALAPDQIKAERDRLTAEVEAERRKRQELEQQLASSNERERITAELDSERRKRQDVEAQLAVQSAPPQISKRNAHALVIGNAAYPGSGRLDNPVNDAKAISQKLRSMGFTVTTVTDANRQKLVQSMAQFRRTAAAADISLLFYSGHGVQIFGTNYMLPTDVDQTDPAQATIQGVSLNSVVENFLPGKTKLVFLDACRDNALQRTTDRSVSKGLAPISAAEGTLISYATKDGQTASDGVGAKNSPFTQALLQHLDDPADIAVVLRKVREKVMQATAGKQQPWEYGSLTGGELVLSKIKEGR